MSSNIVWPQLSITIVTIFIIAAVVSVTDTAAVTT
jgi:hypothetical protein